MKYLKFYRDRKKLFDVVFTKYYLSILPIIVLRYADSKMSGPDRQNPKQLRKSKVTESVLLV